MNAFTILLVPVLPFPEALPNATKYFSRFIFWFENIVNMLPQFLIMNITLFPIIYLKSFHSIIGTLEGFFGMLAAISFWLPMGLIFTPCLILVDVFNLIQILAMHNGCKAE